MANKVGAKIARTVYAILKSNRAYEIEEININENSSSPISKPRNKLLVRYTFLNQELATISKSYDQLFHNSGLEDEPFIRDIMLQFKSLRNSIEIQKDQANIRDSLKKIRELRTEFKATSENK